MIFGLHSFICCSLSHLLILIFPILLFQLHVNDKSEKNKASAAIKKEMVAGTLAGERWFFVKVSKSHTGKIGLFQEALDLELCRYINFYPQSNTIVLKWQPFWKINSFMLLISATPSIISSNSIFYFRHDPVQISLCLSLTHWHCHHLSRSLPIQEPHPLSRGRSMPSGATSAHANQVNTGCKGWGCCLVFCHLSA